MAYGMSVTVENRSAWTESCITLSYINSTLTALGSSAGLRGEKTVTLTTSKPLRHAALLWKFAHL
jgi:hypothetical protein